MHTIQSVCLIGSGNVATHLGTALQTSGLAIHGIYSRTFAHAEALSSRLEGNILATDCLSKLPEADAYIFAVKDDSLPALASELSLTLSRRKAFFIHTSGSIPIEVLTQVTPLAAVIYPMQTFSKQLPLDFRQVPLFIEASDTETFLAVEHLAHLLSNSVNKLSSEGRKQLHLAAVFACNFSNHCYALAFKLLKESAIDPHCLLPLIDETTRKVHMMPPEKAQTGPAIRWDETIMNRQVEALTAHPEMQAVYEAMNRSIHALALAKYTDC